jgi:hypothetical protein
MSSINIRPGVNVLTVLRHLNYKPWFALAEFVDNSLQSYLEHRNTLSAVDPTAAKLSVSILIDPVDRRITVRDNAAGIHQADFPRAFRAAEVPPDRSGLSEFGMGMKSASCWFAPRWRVRTSALGEPVERTVAFDIDSIVRDSLEELAVGEATADPTSHFTEIELLDVFKIPAGRTLGKIREHLTDIYRIYLRQKTLSLSVNGESLAYVPPDIMREPWYRTPNAVAMKWLKDFEIRFSEDRKIYGFAAIRKTASTSQAGFALFRRNRLIQGSGDEGYRPEEIFGRSNTYVYQRVFGELHFQGFGVSHTKDGIQWDGLEEEFLEELRQKLDEEPLPLLRQAREFRFTPRRDELQRAAETAVERTAEAIQRDVPTALQRMVPASTDDAEPQPEFSSAEGALATREIVIEHANITWTIRLEATTDPAVGGWVEISQPPSIDGRAASLGVRLSLVHPFTQKFSAGDPKEIEVLLRIAAALVLAEALARTAGVPQAGVVRRLLNELLRNAFAI